MVDRGDDRIVTNNEEDGTKSHNKKGCTWRKFTKEFPAKDVPQPIPIAEDVPQPIPVTEKFPAADVAEEISVAGDVPSTTQEASQNLEAAVKSQNASKKASKDKS
ncbi:hypothetical protein Salat_2613300 [Sesamum alatum]|uniref:Uncharacterized protein n=1 Tax=Sesamum alatum TaxID=300844 RepID=A0AAE1XP80_9LAMI|nr:hypothetical protein Salat_2613300 [Sesamum alatum]